jgi:hypothetical protein
VHVNTDAGTTNFETMDAGFRSSLYWVKEVMEFDGGQRSKKGFGPSFRLGGTPHLTVASPRFASREVHVEISLVPLRAG